MPLGVLFGLGITTVWLWVVIYIVTGIKQDKWLELFGWSTLFFFLGVAWNFFILITYNPLYINGLRLSSIVLVGVILHFIARTRFGIENVKQKRLVVIIFLSSQLVFGLFLGLLSRLVG